MPHKEIDKRLRAGALVVLVQEPDELLALESAKLASKGFAPVNVVSAADMSLLEKLEGHRNSEGTLIVTDFLRVHGSNPVAVRLVRELALQQATQARPSCSRLILVESPGIEVPQVLRTDIEFVLNRMPTIPELRQELNDFIEQHDLKLDGNGEGLHAIASSVSGLARHEAARLFARCYVEKKTLNPVWLRREKASRVAERLGGALTFMEADDVPEVGGLGNLLKWLGARKKAFGSDAARKYGLPEPKGVLLAGVPGCGKSLVAKTIARDWGTALLRLDAGKLFGSLVGQSESQTRQAIDAAEASSPCVLWIDEMEKGFAQGGLDGGTSQRVFGTMLTWLQEHTKPVFVVATANRIHSLPPEMLRKGRFDDIFFVDLPTLSERTEIAKIHVRRYKLDDKAIRPSDIATATENYSGSEIEQAIIEGMFTAFAAERDVTLRDILEAIRGTVPLSKTMEREIEALRAWANGRAKPAAMPIEQAVGSEKAYRRTPVVKE